jgi:hypothetical protein
MLASPKAITFMERTASLILKASTSQTDTVI